MNLKEKVRTATARDLLSQRPSPDCNSQRTTSSADGEGPHCNSHELSKAGRLHALSFAAAAAAGACLNPKLLALQQLVQRCRRRARCLSETAGLGFPEYGRRWCAGGSSTATTAPWRATASGREDCVRTMADVTVCRSLFRCTVEGHSHGVGVSGNSRVVLQSCFFLNNRWR